MPDPNRLSIVNPIRINPGLFHFVLRSEWAVEPVNLNQPLNSESWENAGALKFDKGWVLAKNDANFLYLAIDVTADTGDDPGTDDYFWLTFDVNRDRSISSNTDINYGVHRGEPENLGKQFYLGSARWTGLHSTDSEVKQEFGVSEYSDEPHRIWKFKIDLDELRVNLAWPFSTPHSFFGLRVKSENPSFKEDFPDNFYKDFSGLRQIIFSRKPTIPSKDMHNIFGSIGLIPSKKIDSGGRATTDSGYYVRVQNAAFGGRLNVIGNRNKIKDMWAKNRRKYKVQIKAPGSSSFNDLISSWTNYRWNGTDHVLETFSANSSGFYFLANPNKDYSIDNLLIQFPTGFLPNGKATLRIRFYNTSGSGSSSADQEDLDIYIDNHLPSAVIEKVLHGGSEIDACAIEKIGPDPDGLRFRLTGHDPEGNLLNVHFRATYGENQSAHIFSEGYPPSKGNWKGFEDKLLPDTWRPPVTCAYSFVLTARARTTNGYRYIGRSTYHKNLTLLLD